MKGQNIQHIESRDKSSNIKVNKCH